MSPAQFLASLKKGPPAGCYLFLGPEHYQRDRCRRALVDAVLSPEEVEHGLTRHDLAETTLAAVVDDAASFSLFAPKRIVWVSSTEAILPKGRVTEAAAAERAASSGIEAYLKNPVPGVTVVFDAARLDLDGDDKTKAEKLAKLFAGALVIEFRRYTVEEALAFTRDQVREQQLKLSPDAIELLVETLGADVACIANELEKLRLYGARERAMGAEELAAMIPNARAANVFSLVNALARRDRLRSIDLLDTLVAGGEYLPLVLAFLGTQFRLALAAVEAGVTNPPQIQAHFSKSGTPMWPSRAQQVAQTIAAFPREKLRRAIRLVFEADRALRDARPDDKIVMEAFVWNLTA